MGFYSTTEQLYDNLRALFACVAQTHPSAGDSLLASRMVIRLRTTDPVGEVVFNARQKPLQTTFGADGEKPDLDIDCTADTFHRLLLGEVSMSKAYGSGLLKVRGPIWRALGMSSLFTASQRCYPGILREQGR